MTYINISMNSKIYKKPYFVILVTFILHILAINFYPINFEYTFIEGMNYAVQNFDKKIITVYFQNQANTFFFPFVGSIIKYIFPYIDPQYIAKFLSASGYFFLGFGIVNLHRILKTKYPLSILLIIIFLNPLIWTFGYRGTPDFLAASIAIYSVSLILDKSISIFKNYIGFFLLGVAIALKPITGIFYITFLIFLLKRKISINEKLKELFLSGLITFIIPIIYFLLIYINFKFFLTPTYYSNALFGNTFTLFNYLNNFILYCGFLYCLCAPILIVNFFYETIYNYLFIFIIGILFFFIGYNFLNSQPEISFGSNIFTFINTRIILGIFCMSFFYFVYYYFKKKDKNYLFFTIFLFLLLISAILPAQRYLLVIIPLMLLFYLNKKNLINILVISCFIYIPINFILLAQNYNSGHLTHQAIKYAEANNLVDNTCFQSIEANLPGDYLNKQKVNCGPRQFHVISIDDNNSSIVFTFENKFLFISKKLYLVRVF